MNSEQTPPEADASSDSVLRFLTCGSVDDGKSTLIGRLLFDSKTILSDTLQHIEKTSNRRGRAELDLSLLTDGLQAEREQGITIDVAYRYFTTGTRKYIIADAPGHEQYTRNMVTAASTAHAAIILIDARKGVLTQTRRHTFLAHLMGVRTLIVAVNKMDLVGYDQEVFEKIRVDYLSFCETAGVMAENPTMHFVPMSALAGDMVVDRRGSLGWYEGPTLLELLEKAPPEHVAANEAFRLPVQYVCRPQASSDPDLHDFRGFMGRIESGSLRVGDRVQVVNGNGQATTVKEIRMGDDQLDHAISEQSVTVTLTDELDISRGDMLIKVDEPGPRITKELTAAVCWLSEAPLSRQRTYTIRHTTRETKAKLSAIACRLDINSLERVEAQSLAMNDIAQLTFKLAAPIFCDDYLTCRQTGSFIVIDDTTNNTVGAGMIRTIC